MSYKSVHDVDLKGKTVFVRIDINSPIIEKKVVVSERIRQHAKTLAFLAKKGAKVVAFAHQGRPGDDDYSDLQQHAAELTRLIGIHVLFLPWESEYKEDLKKMRPGEIILMDNIRSHKEEMEEVEFEEHGKVWFIKELAAFGDYFVQDALSVSHRKHASVVGFSRHLEVLAGPILLEELTALDKGKTTRGKKVLLLGGAKLKESLKMLKHMLKSNLADIALCGGMFGELLLIANNTNFGGTDEFLSGKKDFAEQLDSAKQIVKESGPRIILPVDFAIEKEGTRLEITLEELPVKEIVKDIGSETAKIFAEHISSAELIIWNGPMGVYEEPNFVDGTKLVASAVAGSNAYSVLGGGDTQTAIEACGFKKEQFSYVSLAGKASLEYLSGKELPGVMILKKK